MIDKREKSPDKKLGYLLSAFDSNLKKAHSHIVLQNAVSNAVVFCCELNL